jgi:hypothetical protein
MRSVYKNRLIMRKIIIFTIALLFIVSCSSLNDKYFKILEGEWQVTKFYYENKDLSLNKNYLIGFENNQQLWITKIDGRSDNFISANYKISQKSDSLMININSQDVKLKGNYQMQIDTIQDTGEQFIIHLFLRNKNVHIEAIRPKLKYQ